MIGIRYNDAFLDVTPTANLLINRRSGAIYDVDGSNKLYGQFSYPTDIPATANNLRILGHHTRIELEEQLIDNAPCEIWHNGRPICEGKLYAKSTTHDTLSVYVVVNPLAELKHLKLTDLDLGEITIGGDDQEARNHAYLTATNPDSYDYIFFPVYQDGFWDQGNGPGSVSNADAKITQNVWDRSQKPGSFLSTADCRMASPFVKTKFVLQKIMDKLGYSLDDQLHTTSEMGRMVLYSNYSIYKNDSEWNHKIDLRDHVPPVLAADFLKALRKNFNLSIEFDHLTRTVRVIPMKTKIDDAPVTDWTEYAHRGYRIMRRTNKIGGFGYVDSDQDPLNDSRNDNVYPDSIDYVYQFEDDVPQYLLGWAYSTGRVVDNRLFKSLSQKILGYVQKKKKIDDRSSYILSELQPLHTEWDSGESEFIPHTQMLGTSYPEGQTHTDIDMRVTIYRGIRDSGQQLQYEIPYASHRPYFTRYSASGMVTSHISGEEVSLEWDGAYGLYDVWWKRWNNMLSEGKRIERKFTLPLSEILNHHSSDKIRVGNQDYFVEDIKYVLGRGNRVEVTAILLRCIY